MIKQTVELLELNGSKQLVMNGRCFSEATFLKDDGSPIRRLTLSDEAYDLLKEAMHTGKAILTSESKVEKSEKPKSIKNSKDENKNVKKPKGVI